MLKFPFLKSLTFWGALGTAAVTLLTGGLGAPNIAKGVTELMILLGIRNAIAKNGAEK